MFPILSFVIKGLACRRLLQEVRFVVVYDVNPTCKRA